MERHQCPYLRRSEVARGYPLLGYCLANRDGRLRTVTIAEFRDYCMGPKQCRCPAYLVRSAQEAANAA